VLTPHIIDDQPGPKKTGYAEEIQKKREIFLVLDCSCSMITIAFHLTLQLLKASYRPYIKAPEGSCYAFLQELAEGLKMKMFYCYF
jgi:hypothetical protein